MQLDLDLARVPLGEGPTLVRELTRLSETSIPTPIRPFPVSETGRPAI